MCLSWSSSSSCCLSCVLKSVCVSLSHYCLASSSEILWQGTAILNTRQRCVLEVFGAAVFLGDLFLDSVPIRDCYHFQVFLSFSCTLLILLMLGLGMCWYDYDYYSILKEMHRLTRESASRRIINSPESYPGWYGARWISWCIVQPIISTRLVGGTYFWNVLLCDSLTWMFNFLCKTCLAFHFDRKAM